MLARIRRLLNQFFSKSRTINNEPLNRISLIVIILIDIFILINVFTGLDDISRWYLSPAQAYPCYSEWQNYRTSTTKDKNYETIRLSLPDYISNSDHYIQIYQQAEVGHLGKVSTTCLQYAEYKDQIKNVKIQQTIKAIDQKQTQISNLKQANNQIRAQYDSTLLEKIAGQPRKQSINQVSAEKAKQDLQQNSLKISQIEQAINLLKNELLTLPESVKFLDFIQKVNEQNKIINTQN